MADEARVLDALGDPTRRAVLELLRGGEQSVRELTDATEVSQPAVSQHLRVLRDSGFATVRAAGTRRIYAVDPSGLREVDIWLEQFRGFWEQRLDALGTEIARGRRTRR
jgi:DNA-binding transcriptional ArsR family regulator